MNIAVYAREPGNENQREVLETVLGLLSRRDCSVSIPSIWAHLFKGDYTLFHLDNGLPADTDLLISVGGDGTILDTIMLTDNRAIPVMGVNAGRLGFLTSTLPETIGFAIEEIFKGAYEVELRSLIAYHDSNNIFGNKNFALNDFVIHKHDTGSMIRIGVYINGEFLNTYWADGLIISTPTGSTGYSLSCGGPVLFPKSASFVMTPIAPHNLSLRPIVVGDDSILSFEVEGRGNSFLLSLDSRSKPVNYGNSFAIKRHSEYFRLVQFTTNNFIKTLVNKLLWGADSRNRF